MQREILRLELELEDVELLAKAAQVTGKSFNQLALEAIRSAYGFRTDSTRDAYKSLFDLIFRMREQMQRLKVAIEQQEREIGLLQGKSKEEAEQLTLPS